MAGTVVIGCADQTLAYDLRSQLAEVSDVEVLAVVESTAELARVVVERDPNLVLLHDQLGPEPTHQVVRDLSLRRPASVTLIVSGDVDPETLAAATDAGARGLLTYPLSFAEVQQRITNAIDWSLRLQSLLIEQNAGEGGHRALVLAIAGTKGGVGATTLATHLAWDVRRELPSHRVLLIDLDLEKGDVSSFIEARHRTSIADLAKVSDDLSFRTVADAIYEHESGLHLLLPPEDVREVEHVTPRAIRQIVGLVRQQYDLIVIDVGARVTPLQAAVVEIADEVVAVATPDLVSVRALRRNVATWETLSVRKPEGTFVVLNRHNRADEIQPDTLARLSPSPLLEERLPDLGRKVERAVNSRSPEYVTDVAWWQVVRALGRRLGVARVTTPDGTPDPASRTGRRRSGRDDGSASLEFVGVMPWLVIMGAALVQMVVVALTLVWTGYAASSAARETALQATSYEVRKAAEDAMPSAMHGGLEVSRDATGRRVTVSTHVPILAPGLASSPWKITMSREVVLEP
ncbi:AAA family ATPase [Cellulomonas xiejunii]|uniref:AAA family ATPase n=1 Tax=Cellulomonas xiejunii TaxID=2968083 RepID=A0ABY5KQU5_9CELL|nr:AAA family ATPase [Cellulomonas xiejunii]MCC2312724.1 AAA family ATPase [Cellulomonas xiejunii]MCC2320406.1 AAA family ATPase [Cellulomonas xiejunii]UUI70703.1 AAA family ATPase [Cellulomonas xiejunii]